MIFSLDADPFTDKLPPCPKIPPSSATSKTEGNFEYIQSKSNEAAIGRILPMR